jgi:hypothetical protein
MLDRHALGPLAIGVADGHDGRAGVRLQRRQVHHPPVAQTDYAESD